MYRKDTDGWLKHWDFILLDMICLQLAFVLAYGLSGYGFNPYQTMIYRNMSIYIEVADIAVLFLLGTLRNVLKRGYYREFLITAYQSIVMGAVSVLYLFLIQQGQMYSRSWRAFLGLVCWFRSPDSPIQLHPRRWNTRRKGRYLVSDAKYLQSRVR